MDIMVEGPRTPQVAGMLHEREIPYSVAIADVSGKIEKEHKPLKNIRKTSGYRTILVLDL